MSGRVSSVRASLRGEMRPSVGVHAALVDVRAQEVQAARGAECFDPVEEVLDGGAGILGPAFAQMLAVGADDAGAVLGDAEHALGPVGAGIAFTGVQGRFQVAGAFEQAVDRPTPWASRSWTWCRRRSAVWARSPS
ncbi:hypothetical protein TUSST3_38020 [Streptomyces sp. TUS-ST3]|nr:hypothetical protein TUSST3_38020 [Streptomyces sp. TUS-ST3]